MPKDYARYFKPEKKRAKVNRYFFIFIFSLVGIILGIVLIKFSGDSTKWTPRLPQTTENKNDKVNSIHFEFYSELSKPNPPISSAPPPLTALSTKTASSPVKSTVKSEYYLVQLSLFSRKTEAEIYKNQLGNIGVPLTVVKEMSNGTLHYRVQTVPFNKLESALALKNKLEHSKVASTVRKYTAESATVPLYKKK